jgi:hypothetical protein
MASLEAIYYVGESIVDFLRRSYPAALGACTFRYMSTGEMAVSPPTETTLVLLPYGVQIDEFSRNAARLQGPNAGSVPLGVNLQLLLTVWSDQTRFEHGIMGWAMRQLYMNTVLDRSLLNPTGGWQAEDTLQITPQEPNLDFLLRLWEGLRQPYRLSMTYLARVVKIDVPPEEAARPVVAARIGTGHYDGGAVAPIVEEFNRLSDRS